MTVSTKSKLLALLEANRGEVVSGEDIAARLGVSRAAVWKAAQALRQQGLEVESAPGSGYRLLPESDLLSREAVAAWLGREDLPLRVLPQAASTNLVAKQWAMEGAPHGALVVAQQQGAGRGRRGRAFASPPGGVYMSVVLRPAEGSAAPVLITAAAAVAACRAVESLCGLELGIKWVNDLFYQGKKCCGILCEAGTDMQTGGIEYVVVGIGINYRTKLADYSAPLRDIVTSLYPQGGAPAPRARLVAQVYQNLLALFTQLPGKGFLPEYKARSIVLGRPVTVLAEPPYEALAVDIDDEARLVVQRPDGVLVPLSSGEISIKI